MHLRCPHQRILVVHLDTELGSGRYEMIAGLPDVVGIIPFPNSPQLVIAGKTGRSEVDVSVIGGPAFAHLHDDFPLGPAIGPILYEFCFCADVLILDLGGAVHLFDEIVRRATQSSTVIEGTLECSRGGRTNVEGARIVIHERELLGRPGEVLGIAIAIEGLCALGSTRPDDTIVLYVLRILRSDFAGTFNYDPNDIIRPFNRYL